MLVTWVGDSKEILDHVIDIVLLAVDFDVSHRGLVVLPNDAHDFAV